MEALGRTVLLSAVVREFYEYNKHWPGNNELWWGKFEAAHKNEKESQQGE